MWAKAMSQNINNQAWHDGNFATNCPNAASVAATCRAGAPCPALCTALAAHGNSCGYVDPKAAPAPAPAPAPAGGKRL